VALKIAEAFVEVGARTGKFKRDIRGLQSGMGVAMGGVVAAASGAAVAITAKLGRALAATVVDATMVAAAFEKSMNRVSALTGSSTMQLKEMRMTAQRLGATTEFTASQAADAMGFLAQAGMKSNDIIKAMPNVLNLASAGQLDLASSADIVTNIMAGMQVPVEELPHTVDVLTAAFTNANTDLMQLGQAFKFVGPIASSSGQELRQTTAFLQALGDAGLQASLGGTGLRMILAGLQKEGGPASKVFQDLGVEVRNSDGSLRQILDIVNDFRAAIQMQGRETEMTSLALEAFGPRGGTAFVAAVNAGKEKLDEFLASLTDVDGLAKEIAEKQLQGVAGAITELNSAIEGAKISFGSLFDNELESTIDGIASSIRAIPLALRAGITALEDWDLTATAAFGKATSLLEMMGALKPGTNAGLGMIAKGLGIDAEGRGKERNKRFWDKNRAEMQKEKELEAKEQKKAQEKAERKNIKIQGERLGKYLYGGGIQRDAKMFMTAISKRQEKAAFQQELEDNIGGSTDWMDEPMQDFDPNNPFASSVTFRDLAFPGALKGKPQDAKDAFGSSFDAFEGVDESTKKTKDGAPVDIAKIDRFHAKFGGGNPFAGIDSAPAARSSAAGFSGVGELARAIQGSLGAKDPALKAAEKTAANTGSMSKNIQKIANNTTGGVATFGDGGA